MNKKIVLVFLISLSLLITACGKKQETNNIIVPNEVQAPVAVEPKTDTKVEPIVTSNYSKYSGSFVNENNLINDFKYGIVVQITVDEAGNLKGVVSDCSENAAHISNVNIQGKIQDDKFNYNFHEDGWEHSGSIKLAFKDGKIVLTIKYDENSSKNNLWGIGQGTFALINSNTKVDRTLDNLKDGGLLVIVEQCFSANFENYGNVKFISGLKRENSNDNANFYLTNDKNSVLYKFPDFYGNQKGTFSDISAVSFVDVNKDGLKDIIIVANYNIDGSTKILSSIYFQKGKGFINDKNLDDKINDSLNNKDIARVLKYARNNLTK